MSGETVVLVVSLVISGLAAVAAIGAWGAAAYQNRFQQSWVPEPQDDQFIVFLVRNNTRRPATVLETEAVPRFGPDDHAWFELDAPHTALVMPGAAYGVRVREARGLKITWARKPWWMFGRRKTYEREFSLPLKYNRPAGKQPWYARLFRL